MGGQKIANISSEKAEQEPGLGALRSALGNEAGVFFCRETFRNDGRRVLGNTLCQA